MVIPQAKVQPHPFDICWFLGEGLEVTYGAARLAKDSHSRKQRRTLAV